MVFKSQSLPTLSHSLLSPLSSPRLRLPLLNRSDKVSDRPLGPLPGCTGPGLL